MTSFQKIDALQEEFSGASDRASAIVAGAFLDEILQELLCTFLVEEPKGDKKLFEGTGALATFSAKIEMSFRLGLISTEEHRTLHAVRGIRNDFAHVLGDISFQTTSVKARCKNIEAPIAMVAPKDIPLPEKDRAPPLPRIIKAPSENARSVFQEAVIALMHCLAARVSEAGRDRRVSPADFTEAHQPAEMVLNRFKNLADRFERLMSHELLPEDDKALAAENQRKNALLVRVQEFCVAQIKRAHASRGSI
jgi:hypothetical protein